MKDKNTESSISEVDRPVHKVEPKKVKSGDVMSITHYVKVKYSQFSGTRLGVEGLDEGIDEFQINGESLVENMSSADQFQEERFVTKTKAAEILISTHGKPFTVCYKKQGSESKGDVGEERILRGRLLEPEPLMGRSKVEDLDEPKGKRFRLVDHRTVLFIVTGGCKFTVK